MSFLFNSTIQGETPALKAYDNFLYSSVYSFSDTCADLGGVDQMGKLVVKTFEGLRYIIVLSCRAKAPSGNLTEALTPHLQETTESLEQIRKLRLAPEWTNHHKATLEMLTCVSWVYCVAPNSLPVPFIKECVGSSDFWSNRIRKEFKGKDDNQIAFCDGLKEVMNALAKYVEEYHKTGLTFNPKGHSLEEAAIRLTDTPMADAAAEAIAKKGGAKRASAIGNTVKGGDLMGLMSELSGRKNADGSSAATGLRKVRNRVQLLYVLSQITNYLNSLMTNPFCRLQRSSKHGERSSKRKVARHRLLRLLQHQPRSRKRRKRRVSRSLNIKRGGQSG